MSPRERLVRLSGHHLAAITRRRADGCASNEAFAREQLDRLGWKPNAAGGCGTQRRTSICPSPYQLKSTTVASSPQLSSAVASPDAVALAWKTRSQSAGARSGEAKSTFSLRATSARAGLVSTSVTSPPAIRPQRNATNAPTAPAPTIAIRSAGPGAPSQTALRAVSILAASTARLGGKLFGRRTTELEGTLNMF